MSPKRACHRLATVYLACIHMQIPIDMTTFTYCIFALGHILARQFPIVGFRPPVRLIDIIGRAADTRLHFYLHTFADQFDPARISLHIYPMDLCVCVFFFFFFLPSATSHIAGATISAWCFRARNEHDRRMTASRLPCPASCKNQDCLEI